MDQVMHQLPAVPMRYGANTESLLSSRNSCFLCWWNVTLIVLLLLVVGSGLANDMYLFPGFMGYMGLAYFVYLITMYLVLRKVIGYYLEGAPKLRDEGELTAYVTEMQRAQLQVSLSVVCSHVSVSKSKAGGPTKTKSKTVVTYTASHPFEYATCTDVSALSKNWQQPAGGGGEDGSLGTGFVAVVRSGLKWSAAKGVTADKLKAEKERLYEESKHRDRDCSVTAEASLPGRQRIQLYAPADAEFTKRLSCIAELLLVFFGLGAPLYFYYNGKLSRRIEHTVRKTIYIEGHAAPAFGGVGGAIDIASDLVVP